MYTVFVQTFNAKWQGNSIVILQYNFKNTQ